MRSFRRGVPMLAHFAYREASVTRPARAADRRRTHGVPPRFRATHGRERLQWIHCHRPASRAPTETERMTPRILVVDDDTALAEMIGIVLRTEGFDPAFCADGAGALAAFRETKPDLVLLDLMLPGMDGIEVCGRIRAESGTPIIMLTAKTDTADVVKGLEIGCRRLHGQAVQPQGARRPHPHPTAARTRPRRGYARRRRSHHRRRGTRGAARRRAHQPHARSSSTCCSRSRPSRSRCSPARCCSSRCGATTTRPTPGW